MNERKIKVCNISYEGIEIKSRYDIHDGLDVVEKFLDITNKNGLLGLISKVFIDDKSGVVSIHLIKNLQLKAAENIFSAVIDKCDDYGSLLFFQNFEEDELDIEELFKS